MSKFKFHYNKAYNYFTNTHPIHMLFDAIVVGLGTLAVTGIVGIIYHLTVNGATAHFGIY